MKTYTATAWIIQRGSEQMIKIHQHGCKQDQVNTQPVTLIDNQSNYNRENKVKKIMCQMLHGHQK